MNGFVNANDADGWYGFRLLPASDAAQQRGLEEIAEKLRLGSCRPNDAFLVAYKRTSAPYPDVVVAVPLPPAVALDWLQGRKTAAADVAAMLEQGYRALMDAARRGEEV